MKRYLPVAAAALLVSLTAANAADTDITSMVTDVSTLWASIKVVAIGVVAFVIGRKLLKKV